MLERFHKLRRPSDLAGPRDLAGTRAPAVAGMFYPHHPDELRREVDRYLDQGVRRLGDPGGLVKAVIAPHAGYRYSGPVAGSAFAPWADEGAAAERVVVIGPSHHVAFRGIALPSADALAVPGTTLPVDVDAAADLVARELAFVDPRPHLREHALEVELPFVHALFGRPAIVPLVVGEASAEEVGAALDALWGDAATRLVISSDLSHFLTYDAARAVDGATAEAIETLERDLRADQACGAKAINGLLACASARDLAVHRLDLRSSGDTAGGRDQVVGYGAWALVEGG